MIAKCPLHDKKLIHTSPTRAGFCHECDALWLWNRKDPINGPLRLAYVGSEEAMKNSKALLEEIIEQIREGLPEGTDLEAWIDNADRFDVLDRLKDTEAQFVTYQWGRLLGAAEWADQTVLELLDYHDVSLEDPNPPDPMVNPSEMPKATAKEKAS